MVKVLPFKHICQNKDLAKCSEQFWGKYPVVKLLPLSIPLLCFNLDHIARPQHTEELIVLSSTVHVIGQAVDSVSNFRDVPGIYCHLNIPCVLLYVVQDVNAFVYDERIPFVSNHINQLFWVELKCLMGRCDVCTLRHQIDCMKDFRPLVLRLLLRLIELKSWARLTDSGSLILVRRYVNKLLVGMSVDIFYRSARFSCAHNCINYVYQNTLSPVFLL